MVCYSCRGLEWLYKAEQGFVDRTVSCMDMTVCCKVMAVWCIYMVLWIQYGLMDIVVLIWLYDVTDLIVWCIDMAVWL